MKLTGCIALTCSTLLAVAAAASATQPTIDGLFSKWDEDHLVARDAKGDATAVFDITTVAARTNGTELYCCLDGTMSRGSVHI